MTSPGLCVALALPRVPATHPRSAGDPALADTVSHLLCRGMLAAGIDTLYCLPGVQNDDFFNVLVDFPELKPIVTRHEQGAAYMAAGAAQATGRPAAYCTVPGQGVLNAAAGHSTALATATRVFALIGQNRTSLFGRGYGLLHEIPDQLSVLAQISKFAVALRDAHAAPGQIAQAFQELLGGRPAPVTLECPLDLWTAEAKEQPAAPPDMDCRVEPLRVPRVITAYTEDDLITRQFLRTTTRRATDDFRAA